MNNGYFRLARMLSASLVVLALAGCGGGGNPAGCNGCQAGYAVGGTVTGLTGSGLVLRDNGADDLAISADGAFAFSIAVAPGSPYLVSVFTQPSAPAETCTVAHGSGKIAGTNITTVAVSCVLAVTHVTVEPASANLAAGGAQQFSATVTGTAGTALTWKVNGVPGGSTALGTVTGSGLYVAPNVATTVTVTAELQENPATYGSGALTVLAPHRIGVRTGSDGYAELFDRITGSSFIARGNNYVRLANLTKYDGSTQYSGHSTFIVGLYDALRAENALALMQSRGFNTVRVFLEGCCLGSIGDPAGILLEGYIANVVDYLQRAKRHGIFVIISSDWVPDRGNFGPGCTRTDQFALQNLLDLCAGGVAIDRQFQQEFVKALVAHQAPLDAVLGFQLRNEYFYDQRDLPFTLTSGTVRTANGSTYDMADPVARQRMMDEGLTYFTDTVAAGIREVDPTALVTVGFFWPQTPNPSRIGDTRLISVYPAIAASTADFVDIHAYIIPGELNMDQVMQNYALTGYQQSKPVVMGEYGVFLGTYGLITDAAAGLKAWQIASCPYHLKGWLLWTWDTDEQVPGLWTDQAGDGSIDQALAPAARPDPCVP